MSSVVSARWIELTFRLAFSGAIVVSENGLDCENFRYFSIVHWAISAGTGDWRTRRPTPGAFDFRSFTPAATAAALLRVTYP